MNIFEARRVLRNNGYRIINEMAQSARDYVFSNLNIKKKAIYLLMHYADYCNEELGTPVERTTVGNFKKYIDSKSQTSGLTWDEFLAALDVEVSGNPRIGSTGLYNILTDEHTRDIYNNILNTITRSKDNIDHDIVDKVYDVYKRMKHGEDATTLATSNDMRQVITWLRNPENEQEASERFGVRWPTIKKAFRRWIGETSLDEQSWDMFGDWWRAIKNHREPQVHFTTDHKTALVNIALDDGAIDKYGNLVWTLRKRLPEILGMSIEDWHNRYSTKEYVVQFVGPDDIIVRATSQAEAIDMVMDDMVGDPSTLYTATLRSELEA